MALQTARARQAITFITLSWFKARRVVQNDSKFGAAQHDFARQGCSHRDAEKGGFANAAQDWAYYTDKVRQARYAFDQNQLKPYFENHEPLLERRGLKAN